MQVHFNNLTEHILNQLKNAEQEITLVVSWLTDKEIYNILIEKLNSGVQVNLVTRNDYLNNQPEALDWNLFIAKGGNLWFSIDGMQIHYKFIIIDGKTLLCTSYNLTCFANGNNRENILIFNNPELIEQFQAEFTYLTKQLSQVNLVDRIMLNQVPNPLHGFYESTLKADKSKQRV